ncbi:MAG: hypothetical protein IAE89_04775, partial [Anaerolineae bacterium]|nr:hypothetical protein [Anaerolineae bacterium]
WERIIFDWAQHQPEGPDDWNPFNVLDEWLQAAADCDREVVAIVKHTPAWATDGTPGIGVPRGLYQDIDDPENLWASFMREAAEYYAARDVSRFIIWNEPDIPAGTYGYEFEGSLEDYARLLQVAYLAAKQGNSEAEIILAGTTYWHDVNVGRRLYADRLLEYLSQQPDAAENGYFFDALALHIYFRTDTIYTIVHEYAVVLERYGMQDKELWIVETNASPNLDPLWPVIRPQYQITLDQQGAFLIQAAALGLAAGADRIGVYKFFDWSLPPGAEAFGLIRADETRRPAFESWRAVIDRFEGVRTARIVQTDLLQVVELRRGDGSTMLAAWARTEMPVEISFLADGQATITDQYGNIMPLAISDSHQFIMLAGALCNRRDGCAVGGNPVLIDSTGELSEVSIGQSGERILLAFGEEILLHGGE